MKRRSFLSALAALPFLPKLLREKPPALGVPIGPAVSTWHGIPIADMECPQAWTSGTYSDAVTYTGNMTFRAADKGQLYFFGPPGTLYAIVERPRSRPL